ncbi:MAG: type I-E CRISPR-associated protein Cas5/CasD, partial [Desulfuromonadaceae bacterium]|nr:type I-E CRISPR-associated protein Cas5/CasD [Desulfuromonadaceae bacterium]
VWGLWLGRKCCIPTAPVLFGIWDKKEDALQSLIGSTVLDSFTYQEDVSLFVDGRDSIPDLPISFASSTREHSPRRVNTHQGSNSVVSSSKQRV